MLVYWTETNIDTNIPILALDSINKHDFEVCVVFI